MAMRFTCSIKSLEQEAPNYLGHLNLYFAPILGGLFCYNRSMETIRISSTKREEIIDITGEVRAIVRNSKVRSGIVVVYVPHTTAAVTINENADPSVKRDIINTLSKLIPENDRYAHLEGNADAHIKASVVGSSRIVIIEDGEIQ